MYACSLHVKRGSISLQRSSNDNTARSFPLLFPHGLNIDTDIVIFFFSASNACFCTSIVFRWCMIWKSPTSYTPAWQCSLRKRQFQWRFIAWLLHNLVPCDTDSDNHCSNLFSVNLYFLHDNGYPTGIYNLGWMNIHSITKIGVQTSSARA